MKAKYDFGFYVIMIALALICFTGCASKRLVRTTDLKPIATAVDAADQKAAQIEKNGAKPGDVTVKNLREDLKTANKEIVKAAADNEHQVSFANVQIATRDSTIKTLEGDVKDLKKQIANSDANRNRWCFVSSILTLVIFLACYFIAKMERVAAALQGVWLPKFIPLELAAGIVGSTIWLFLLVIILKFWTAAGVFLNWLF